LIVIFLDSQIEDKRFCTERQEALPHFSQLLIYEYRTQKYLRKAVVCISNAPSPNLSIHLYEYFSPPQKTAQLLEPETGAKRTAVLT
jgi:hypothetical protein